MVLCKINNNWHKHWEGLFLISFQYVEEIIIFKEAHCSIDNLEMDTTNTLHNSLEESWDKMLNFINLADLKNFLEFSQEEGFLNTIGKRPKLKESFE